MATRKSFSSATETPKVNPLEGLTFDVDGVEFECQGQMGFLDMSDLARRVSDLPSTDLDELQKIDPLAAAAMISSMSSTLLMALGASEYRRFRDHVRTHATPDDVIVEVMQWINAAVQGEVEAEAGRPTGPPPLSSSGEPEPGARMSRIISLQTGDVTVLPDGVEPPGAENASPPPPARQPAKTTIKELGPKTGGRRRTA
jgi:hypothetical protein